MNYESYSQMGEDRIVAYIIRSLLGRREIVYLDIGANDPIHLNNTYWFYKNFHVKKGILVEPNPALAEKIREIRPGDILVNAGVMAEDGEKEADYYEMDEHTLNSFSEEEAGEYLKKGHRIVRKTTLPIIGINSICSRYLEPSERIDFLSIDIEGMDMEVMRSMDMKRYAPSVVCMETAEYFRLKRQDYDEVLRFFNEAGYELFADTFINSVFIRRRGMIRMIEAEQERESVREIWNLATSVIDRMPTLYGQSLGNHIPELMNQVSDALKMIEKVFAEHGLVYAIIRMGSLSDEIGSFLCDFDGSIPEEVFSRKYRSLCGAVDCITDLFL